MTPVVSLWLPILLSAVACFIVSSLIHMMTPWHKGDYGTLPNEEGALGALRPFNIPPGDYMAPKPASMDDMKSAAFAEKRNRGPVLIVTVLPNGPVAMGGQLGAWFVYLVVIAAIAACVAGATLHPGADPRSVFHYVAVTAFLGFAGALWQMNIWYKRSLGTTIRSTIDGAIYAAITAAIFMQMWPKS